MDASLVEPTDRQRIATQLGYRETIFIDLPDADAHPATAHISTPTAGLVQVGYEEFDDVEH